MTTLQQKLIHGSGLLLGGQALAQGLSFARNIIVARLLSPEDFGIAAMLVLVVAVLDMLSNLSVDRLLVQAPDGDRFEFEASAHAVQMSRGLLTAALLFLAAWPAAWLFKVPEARWAFQTIALVPLIRGAAHLDRKRLHREMRFGGDVLTDTVPQVLALALAWPLAYGLRDYSALVWILLAQALAFTLASHLVASRPYRLSWNRAYVARLVSFGWPLAVNGLLMSAIFQGDKFIIGAAYTPRDLGIYSVAFSLAMLPVLSVARVNASLLLPLLADRQSRPAAFTGVLRQSSGLISLCACLLGVGYITGGPIAIVLLYGESYRAAGLVVGWLGVMQSIRLMRDAQSQAAMALGESKNPMYANLVRNLALAGMVAVAYWHLPLVWFGIVGTVGELAAMVFATLLLRRQHGLEWSSTLGYPARALLCIGACMAATEITDADQTLPGALIAFAGAVAVTAFAFRGLHLTRLNSADESRERAEASASEPRELAK